ncbi:MAG TPA: energy transducer TonB [Ferruginibacter sp.]|jgi:protein TonB|nr:energy transducer TonB [Ferruginibacter sp.]
MDINKILSADILDIIFEGRNKEYGAYELRKTYNGRLTKALLITASFLAVLLISFAIAHFLNKTTQTDKVEVIDTQIAEIKQKDPTPPVPPPPPIKPPPPPAVNQVAFTPPVVKKDKDVAQDEKPPDITEKTAISDQTIKSDNTQQVVQQPIDTKGTGIVTPPVNDDSVFEKVEIEAAFPGGPGAWAAFLKRNLDADVPVNNGAPVGMYRVVVRFIVGRDGSAYDVQAETNLGYGMEDEAIRAIKKAPKWTPAQQNGRVVIAYKKQPITFVVTGDE